MGMQLLIHVRNADVESLLAKGDALVCQAITSTNLLANCTFGLASITFQSNINCLHQSFWKLTGDSAAVSNINQLNHMTISIPYLMAWTRDTTQISMWSSYHFEPGSVWPPDKPQDNTRATTDPWPSHTSTLAFTKAPCVTLGCLAPPMYPAVTAECGG